MILHVALAVEAYVEQEFHRRIRPPERCEHCGALSTLKRQAYYPRYTTDARGVPVLFRVARFICTACERTTSCLPSFAQPYRLVASATIEAYVQGDVDHPAVQRTESLLKRYLQRFGQWWEHLRKMLGVRWGRGPPQETATAFWRRTVAACGSLAELTLRLVQEYRTTCFGTYCCHQPSRAR